MGCGMSTPSSPPRGRIEYSTNYDWGPRPTRHAPPRARRQPGWGLGPEVPAMALALVILMVTQWDIVAMVVASRVTMKVSEGMERHLGSK
jgi:hypothetical protein